MISDKFEKMVSILGVIPNFSKYAARSFLLSILNLSPNERQKILESLEELSNSIKNCERCNFLSEDHLCKYCRSPNRLNRNSICVVEYSQDVEFFDHHPGTFFVLGDSYEMILGHGPRPELLEQLNKIIKSQKPQEVIIAIPINGDNEHIIEVLLDMALQAGVPDVTKMSLGVPYGGSFASYDGHTLELAYKQRIKYLVE